MALPIAPVSSVSIVDAIRPAAQKGAGGFQDVLAGAIQSVEASGRDASASVERFLTGEGEDLHTTVLATQRAELTFDMFLQMRNKVVNAYQEIMRMQI
jgi:flagellar hook-basal body complex protein FliE